MLKTACEVLGLIMLGAASRLLPHPPNMTAISAIGLKSTARFGVAGISLPLVSMLLTDLVIGFYDWRLLVSVYASFALVALLGRFCTHERFLQLGWMSILGSCIFFLVTNTVVWASSLWYPHTASGLLLALVAGLPFFSAMLVGDLVYTFVLFRSRSLIKHLNVRRFVSVSRELRWDSLASDRSY